MLATVEVLLYKADYLFNLSVSVRTRLKYAQVFECLLLSVDKYTCQHLLIQYGIGLDTIGYYVVDILDEHYICIDVVEVLDEGAMATWTEQQSAVFVAERSIVGVGCDCVGAGLLLREAYIKMDVIEFLKRLKFLSNFALEQLKMLVRHGKVDVGLAVRAGIECCLNEVFLHRSARSVLVVVE